MNDPLADPLDEALLAARAALLRDLTATGAAGPRQVDLLDDVLGERRGWSAHWPDGAPHLPGLVAQDLQERLLGSTGVRWPPCTGRPAPAGDHEDDEHELRIEPDLGPDPRWTCERGGRVAVPLGALAAGPPGEPGG